MIMSVSDARPVVLFGPMGVGKSTVGAEVARRLQRPFIDLDARIEERLGRSIRAVFDADGEAAFRKVESDSLFEELASESRPSPVIAVGGGCLVDDAVRGRVLRRAFVVGLQATPEDLGMRIGTAIGDRPLLDASGGDPVRVIQLLAGLVRERAQAYDDVHFVMSTTNRSAAEVAARLTDLLSDVPIPVATSGGAYAVHIVRARKAGAAVAEVIDGLSPSSVVVVTDENVASLPWFGPIVDAIDERGPSVRDIIRIPPGEPHKNIGTLERILEGFVAAELDRRSIVIGVGGGVVTDVVGLAASLFARGVRWVAVPTTMLAMADASVGGKTAVNLGRAKNIVGAFHQPCAVVIDPTFVRTESVRAYRSGMAEVVKAALVGNPALFDWLRAQAGALSTRDEACVTVALRGAIEVKARIVERDPDEKGERVVLNFGHTLGHALEALGDFAELLHGEAIAMGMVAACGIGALVGSTPRGLARDVSDLIRALGLPTSTEPDRLLRAVELASLDKKRAGNALAFVLLSAAGAPCVQRLTLDDLRSLVARLVNDHELWPRHGPSLD